jgi:hypothetical protein
MTALGTVKIMLPRLSEASGTAWEITTSVWVLKKVIQFSYQVNEVPVRQLCKQAFTRSLCKHTVDLLRFLEFIYKYGGGGGGGGVEAYRNKCVWYPSSELLCLYILHTGVLMRVRTAAAKISYAPRDTHHSVRPSTWNSSDLHRREFREISHLTY